MVCAPNGPAAQLERTPSDSLRRREDAVDGFAASGSLISVRMLNSGRAQRGTAMSVCLRSLAVIGGRGRETKPLRAVELLRDGVRLFELGGLGTLAPLHLVGAVRMSNGSERR